MKIIKKALLLFFVLFSLSSVPVSACESQADCPNGYYCYQHVTLSECRPNPGSNNPPPFNINQGPTNETFEAVDPLVIGGSPYATNFASPGGILSRVLVFAFPIAGLLLFSMIVWGGFEILAGAHDKKSMDAGRQRVTAAIVGFLLLFSSYWIAQIVEYIFGITIL